MAAMAYEFIARYERDLQDADGLEARTAHALGDLALVTGNLLEQTGARREAWFMATGEEGDPALALPLVPGVPAFLHAEKPRHRAEDWFVAAYLPTMRRVPRGLHTMNFALWSANPPEEKALAAHVGRYIWTDGRLRGSRVPRRHLTPHAVLEALVPAVRNLANRFGEMEDRWHIT